MFPIVKSVENVCSLAPCNSTAPVSENAEVLRLPAQSCSELFFCKRAHASRWCPQPLSFRQLFTCSASNHLAGIRPPRMPSWWYEVSAWSTRESPGVLSTNTACSVSVVLRELAPRPLNCKIVCASGNPMLTSWLRCGQLERACF